MAKIISSNSKLTLEQIEQFEVKSGIKLPEKYITFLLHWNGGYTEPSFFKISKEQGSSVVNVLNGIGDMYDNLEKVIDMYEYRLPKGFIPIGDDPGGNVICLGTIEPYHEKIYFWDHENEPENPDGMKNMYFLANNIYDFLDKLYDEIPDELTEDMYDEASGFGRVCK